MGKKEILAVDPRGLPVEFWDERWEYITDEKHQDLVPAGVTRAHIKQAIENPADGCIFASKKYHDCDLYYLPFRRGLQLRVVVRYVDEVGEILTAHLIRDRAGGEEIRWIRGK